MGDKKTKAYWQKFFFYTLTKNERKSLFENLITSLLDIGLCGAAFIGSYR